MNGKDFVNRQQALVHEVLEEIKNSKSPRVEILLLTNFVESVLSDFMEFLLETEKARRIPRKRIVSILENRRIIPAELAQDIKFVFNLRDLYAHKLSLNQANSEAEKILPRMNCVKNVFVPRIPSWKEFDLTRKIIDVADSTFAHLLMQFDQIANEPIRIRTQKYDMQDL